MYQREGWLLLELRENERENLVKIAYWYYKKNMTQAEIGKRLGYTRQRVNQLIGALVDLGVVEIQINGLKGDYAALEDAIEKQFSLKQVSIITGSDSLQDFGRKAAEIVGALLADNMTVGMSWGVTLGETVGAIQPKPLPGSAVVQLVGGLNSSSTIIRSDEITRIMGQKLSCPYYILYAPAFVDSSVTKKVMLEERPVAEAMELMKQCDLAIIGVGDLKPTSTIVREGFISEEYMKALQTAGCIGDICMIPFNEEGEIYDHENNTIGIEIDTLRMIPNVVMLARGAEKTDAVIGAIKTKSIDTVVIDVGIAEKIAEQYALC